MIKNKKVKRKCRKCSKVLPPQRYFNCTKCQPNLPDESYTSYYGEMVSGFQIKSGYRRITGEQD